MNDTSKRIEWIDIAKGITMILIVWGHNLDTTSLLFRVITSFAVATFMFLSGWFHKQNISFKEFVYKKLITLVRPYYIFGIIFLTVYTIYKGYDISGLKALYFGGKTILGEVEFDGPLWFFLCLFIVSIYYYCLKKIMPNKLILLLVLIILSCIGRNFLLIQRLPYSMDAALYWLLFYGLGDMFRENKDKILINVNVYTYVLLWIVSVIALVMYPYACNRDLILKSFTVVGYLIGLVSAFGGIFIVLECSKFISRKSKILKRIFTFYGVNSLIITAVSNPIRDFGYGILIWGLTGTFYQGVFFRELQIIGTLLLCIPVVVIINSYFPNIVGKNKSHKTC